MSIFEKYCYARVHLNCTGFTLVPLPKLRVGEVYLLNSVKVNSTHAVATHHPLKLHFCIYRGAYTHLGKFQRTRGLAIECPAKPTDSGLRALRVICNGRDPARFLNLPTRQPSERFKLSRYAKGRVEGDCSNRQSSILKRNRSSRDTERCDMEPQSLSIQHTNSQLGQVP